MRHTVYKSLGEQAYLSLRFRASQFYTTIIQQDAAVRSQFYFTAALLYMFRVLSAPIIRSTLTVSTASGTGHTSVQLSSSNVAEFETWPRWRKVAAPMYDLYRRL